MQWLVTPPQYRDPPTRAQLALEIGVSLRTLQIWMSKTQFRESYPEEPGDTTEVASDSERVRRVLDVLYEAALDPTNRSQVSAAKLYLEATRAIQPGTQKVEVVRPKDLSDEELDAMLAENAAIAKAVSTLDPSVVDD